jgi:hypothetical protein
LLVAAIAVVAAAAYLGITQPWKSRPVRTALAPSATVAASAPDTLVDPLNVDRPVTIDATPRAGAGDWVKARPAFQYSRPAAERGGIEPCSPQKFDRTAYEEWVPLLQGHFSAPRALQLDEQGHFDLVIHLNGDGPVQRELIRSGQPLVLYTLTISASRSYAPLFSSPYLLDAIVAGIEKNLSERAGRPASVGRIALSAWSAGFVGVGAALGQPKIKDVRNIDAVILIDGLHAPRNDRSSFKAQLQPFVDYAVRAAAKERFMFVSHSSIDPPNFASTSECAHYLVSSLAGRPQPVRRLDTMGLELIEFFSKGDLHVRGYAGNDKADHCAQLALLRDAFTALGRRWAAAPPPAAPPSATD